MSSYGHNLLSWLRDAHAMEEQAEQLFSGQAKRLKDYGQLSLQLETEARESIEHQKLLSIRIQQLGSDISILKDAAAKLVAVSQNLSGVIMSDEPVKGMLSLYTFNHMGIGSYLILIAAAEAANDAETTRLCTEILNQYKARAIWLEEYLHDVTELFLYRSEAAA